MAEMKSHHNNNNIDEDEIDEVTLLKQWLLVCLSNKAISKPPPITTTSAPNIVADLLTDPNIVRPLAALNWLEVECLLRPVVVLTQMSQNRACSRLCIETLLTVMNDHNDYHENSSLSTTKNTRWVHWCTLWLLNEYLQLVDQLQTEGEDRLTDAVFTEIVHQFETVDWVGVVVDHHHQRSNTAQQWRATLCAAMLAEQLLVHRKLTTAQCCQLRAVSVANQNCDHYRSISVVVDPAQYCLRREVVLYAHWLGQQLLDIGTTEQRGSIGKRGRIKLSLDRLEVRQDSLDYCAVRCQFPVESTAGNRPPLYFEVIWLTEDEIRVGWATRLLDKHHSIWLEIIDNQCYVAHNFQVFQIACLNVDFAPPLAIGCRLDADRTQVAFYVNGRQMPLTQSGAFQLKLHPSLPYFATAQLTQHQQCWFNLGHTSFLFPPPFRCTTIVEQCAANPTLAQLAHTEWFDSDFYWFRHDTAAVHFDSGCLSRKIVRQRSYRYFEDAAQRRIDQTLCETVQRIRQQCQTAGDLTVNGKEFDRLERSAQKYRGWRAVRLVQSILEWNIDDRGKEEVSEQTEDMVAQWIGLVLDRAIDEVNRAKLIELLALYLGEAKEPVFSVVNHRSLCTVLMHLVKLDHHFGYQTVAPIHSEVFDYLLAVFANHEAQNDHWTALFALTALRESMTSTLTTPAQIGQCTPLVNALIERVEKQKLDGNDEKLAPVLEQLLLVGHNFLLKHSCRQTELTLPTIDDECRLSITDQSGHLLLSADRRSARCERHWTSVRSECSARSGNDGGGLHYFEVRLLTSGPAAIGWATKRTDLSRVFTWTTNKARDNIEQFSSLNEIQMLESRRMAFGKHDDRPRQLMVGIDEFSIAYNGYDRCVYHDGRVYPVDDLPRWKVGDVIGCLLDQSKPTDRNRPDRFVFYLNGQKVALAPPPSYPVYFSTQPYHTMVCLSALQQCECNFGQRPFSHHRPRRVDFTDFVTSAAKTESQTRPQSQLHLQVAGNMSNNLITMSETRLGNASLTTKVRGPTASTTAHAQPPHNYCRLCHQSTATKLVMFLCCTSDAPMCVQCLTARALSECPKCGGRPPINRTDDQKLVNSLD